MNQRRAAYNSVARGGHVRSCWKAPRVTLEESARLEPEPQNWLSGLQPRGAEADCRAPN
jgi:hypothetical protein